MHDSAQASAFIRLNHGRLLALNRAANAEQRERSTRIQRWLWKAIDKNRG
jgi:hypothetical protein